jgi:hypothetical protein
VDFSVEQTYAAAPDAVARAYATAELYARLDGLGKLGGPEVLDRQVDGSVVRLAVRYRFVGHLAPAVTAVLDPARLTWVEHTTHDLAERTVRFRLVPDHYRDRLTSEARGVVVPGGRSGSVRSITGTLKVRAVLVAPTVERAIVSGLREHLVAEAPVVDRTILEGG